jgi:MerR family mercuric resistance operon transcriptional regulator
MPELTIGKLATAAGTDLETVRYYERIGLMPEPPRTTGGHRLYEAAHTRRLRFIRRARELGFSINDIRALLKLAEPSRTVCGDVRKIAAVHLESVRARLADLIKMESLLAATVAKCNGDGSPACPILEMLEADSPDLALRGNT